MRCPGDLTRLWQLARGKMAFGVYFIWLKVGEPVEDVKCSCCTSLNPHSRPLLLQVENGGTRLSSFPTDTKPVGDRGGIQAPGLVAESPWMRRGCSQREG